MSSRHGQPQHSWRPEPGEYAHAKASLHARSRTMSSYLRACLRWLNRDPEAALATLAPFWPQPRPTGRPRGRDHTSRGDGTQPDQARTERAP